MHNYFTDKCAAVLSAGGVPKIYGVYDIKFSEYIISFEVIGEVPGETLAFNEDANLFSSFYSYLPDFMCGANTGLVTFKKGALYTHNTNVLQANFYAAQNYPQLWIVVNDNPSNVKVLEAIAEETMAAWAVSSVTTPGGQESSLAAIDISLIEGQEFSSFLRDINTPNITAPALPIFEGDPMRDVTFLCKLTYPGTDYNKIFAVNFRYAISNLHNK